jgi:4-amino-4-deoxy-L-arabinose transferase-like glycosyltransferase
MPLRKPLIFATAAVVIFFLYFFHLSAAGMLGPDEPRYASIGREMARSGDWITPRLWGEPWFEKPALLYWMTGAAFRLGLRGELAPRLPVALLSVTFLLFFFWILRREFGERVAWFGSIILATSAGWIGMSQVATTDIPLATTFSAAVLLSLPWVTSGCRRQLPYASACLGLSALAKGFVGPALILPVLWFGRKRLRDLLRPLVWAPFLVVAAPWYVACFLRNGWPFLNMFIWRHHVERVFSGSLMHGQPFWFYLPVFLAAVFPWTPLVPLIFRQKVRHVGMLFLATVMFGLILFSIPLNKVPEYLLPLLPSAAVLMALAAAELSGRAAGILLGICAALASVAPFLSPMLPDALARGISKSPLPTIGWLWIIPVILCWMVRRLRPLHAMAAILIIVTAGIAWLKIACLPMIDQAVSARPVWLQVAPQSSQVCVQQMHRSWRYGLNFYSETPLPDCAGSAKPIQIRQQDAQPPVLAARE